MASLEPIMATGHPDSTPASRLDDSKSGRARPRYGRAATRALRAKLTVR